MTPDTKRLISVRREISRKGEVYFVADGPPGHSNLLTRFTKHDAEVDGEAYFLRTREYVDGEWRLR